MSVRNTYLFLAAVASIGFAFVSAAIPQQMPASPSNGNAPSAPAANQARQQQLFDKWMYSCESGACQVYLTLADSTTKEAKFSWAFVYDPKRRLLSALVTVPSGVALPPGVHIRVDDKIQYTWPLQVCDGTGCRAVAVLTDTMFESLAKREKVIVQYVPYGAPKASSFEVPMTGLADAVKNLIAQGTQGQK